MASKAGRRRSALNGLLFDGVASDASRACVRGSSLPLIGEISLVSGVIAKSVVLRIFQHVYHASCAGV
jgi:hypothetical protein